MLSMIIDNISSFMYSKLLDGLHCIKSGTGNIVGVSSAICIGGFGAVFWMWVIAIINIPVILILSNTAMKALKDYERKLKMGMNPVFKSKDIGMKEKLDCWK